MRDLTPEEQAACFRARASMHRMMAARNDLMATVTEAAASMRKFATVMQAGFNGEVAAHPDLAELNVQLDGYYDPA